VRVLVDKNVDMKHKNGRGVTALVAAARKKHMNIVNLLLAKGADAESVIDADGKTLLLYACGNGYVDTVKILLEKRANIHAINKDGDDALNVACKETYFFNIDVVKCLIKHIIKIGAQDLLFKFDNHDKLPFDYISNDKVREDLEVYAEELIEKGDASSNHNSAKDNALESTSAPDAAAAGAAAGAATDNSKPETTAEKPSFRHTRQASMKAKEIAATPDQKKDCTCLIM